MKVAVILKDKGGRVVTLAGDTKVSAAIETLARERIGAVVILDAQERIAGVFSERDCVRAIAEEGAEALARPISDLMTRKVVSCSEEDTLDHVLELMTQGRFRHLPVVAEERLRGIISIGDVVKMKIASSEQEAEALRAYISAG